MPRPITDEQVRIFLGGITEEDLGRVKKWVAAQLKEPNTPRRTDITGDEAARFIGADLEHRIKAFEWVEAEQAVTKPPAFRRG